MHEAIHEYLHCIMFLPKLDGEFSLGWQRTPACLDSYNAIMHIILQHHPRAINIQKPWEPS
jgi:hypothetical protein